ncbi:MAG: hypothetical protein IJ711_09120 [Lachnospiraceae bacterium]|nr:hypothetical protein [Lachnospiraceae bacterium]
MEDFRKLWRMQGGYFVIAFCIIEGIAMTCLCCFKYHNSIMQWRIDLGSYGFVSMHRVLIVLLIVLLFVRHLFAADKGNQEFICSLPVRRVSWQLFTTLAGIALLLCVYLATFLVYAQMGGRMDIPGAFGISEIGILFLKGFVYSVLEYHGILAAGFLCRLGYAYLQAAYQKTMEGADEG